jgi:hypothetical protein
MELEVSQERHLPVPERAAESAAAPGPSAEFELEKPYEAPATAWRSAEAPPPESLGERTVADGPAPGLPATGHVEPTPPLEAAAAPVPQAAAAPVPPPPPVEPGERTVDASFEYTFEPVRPAVVTPRPAMPPVAEPLSPSWEPASMPPVDAMPPSSAPGGAAAAPAALAPAPASTPEQAELVSPTLAELYLNQGFRDKAIEVYRRLLEREPGNERARVRLADLEGAAEPAAASSSATPAPEEVEAARAARRQALERTIDRLESLRAALQRGTR